MIKMLFIGMMIMAVVLKPAAAMAIIDGLYNAAMHFKDSPQEESVKTEKKRIESLFEDLSVAPPVDIKPEENKLVTSVEEKKTVASAEETVCRLEYPNNVVMSGSELPISSADGFLRADNNSHQPKTICEKVILTPAEFDKIFNSKFDKKK